MKLIQREQFNKTIGKDFDYTFEVKEEGVYLIEIIASAESWKQKLGNDDDLTVKINNTEFPK